MIATKLKRISALILLVAFVAAISSCNRGMGCPTFSLDQDSIEILD